MPSRQELNQTIAEADNLIASKHIGSGYHTITDREVEAAELYRDAARARLESMSAFETLYDLLDTWEAYEEAANEEDADDVADAIYQHARAVYGNPDYTPERLREVAEMIDDVIAIDR